MNVDELLTQAWSAVEKAGVPQPLQELALKEAIGFLRSANGSATSVGNERREPDPSKVGTGTGSGPVDSGAGGEDGFFAKLAHESGVGEDDLRDILNLTPDGAVQVIPPTRSLGSTTAEQAKTIITLVAGARGKGLLERPVDGSAVRAEVVRKDAYQSNNYATSHLGPLKGFNVGSSRSEILLTSRWDREFRRAVATAHGRPLQDEG